jgi:hypothetical protein
MSTTVTTAPTPIGIPNSAGVPTTRTDQAIEVSRDGAKLIANLQTADPALYAQLVGSLMTYAKSGAAPVVGAFVGVIVAHWGLACTATAVNGCFTPDMVNMITYAIVGAGTALGAVVMHWIGKIPGRKLAAGVPVAPSATLPGTQGTTP